MSSMMQRSVTGTEPSGGNFEKKNISRPNLKIKHQNLNKNGFFNFIIILCRRYFETQHYVIEIVNAISKT
jgi:hypothetical protein